ncbi:MAG: nicotinate-nicotinamide nucleotide adenylyltransferase, partial [Opitutales bacterium]
MDSRFEGDAGKALRVGLFGGTFDPVHCAHLEIARRVRGALSLDRVIFIPNAQSPIKESAPGASGS